MSINIGDKVGVSLNSESTYERGTVVNIYRLMTQNIAIVKLDDGEIVKAPLESMFKLADQTKPEPKTETPKDSRTISESEFLAAIGNLTLTKTDSNDQLTNIIVTMTVAMVGSDIAHDMFKETKVITLTKDEFVSVIWNGCSPDRIRNSVSGDMDLYTCLSVSTAGLTILRKLVEVFFPKDESGNA